MDQDFRDLLDRFLKGNCTPQEIEKIRRWYDDIDDRKLQLGRAEKKIVGARMLGNLRKQLQMPDAPLQRRRRLVSYQAVGIAAAVLLAMASFIWFYMPADRAAEPEIAMAPDTADAVVCENISDTTQRYELPDKSTVDLEPSGRLSFSRNFSSAKREVYLSGKAFFEVVKDPSRPFYVYAGQVATRVLGTSFFVSAPLNATKVEVKVITGKVSVFQIDPGVDERSQRPSVSRNSVANGVVLSPNQKVEYFTDGGHWVTGLVDNPLPLRSAADEQVSFVFANTSVKDVLRAIGERYGIEVVTENEKIYRCAFTGDVSRMALYDMLDVISNSIGSTYVVKGTRILVSGKGCD